MKKIKLVVLILILALSSISIIDRRETFVDRTNYSVGNGSNYLSNVSFVDVDFSFDKEVMEYTITVPFSKKTLGLTYVQEDPNSIVEVIGDEELYVGNNSLVILVTSSTGEQRQYGFTILRTEDNTFIPNEEISIKDALLNGEENTITVAVTGEGVILGEDTLDAFKTSGKVLYYEWRNQGGEFISSLKIDSKNIDSEKKLNPNIKNGITTAKLVKFLEGYQYLGFSTKDTNIPDGSVYTVTVDGDEDIYTLYYYDNDRIESRSLRNMDGKVEFSIKNGIDYALISKKDAPQKESISGFSWILPTLIMTIMITVFIVATRQVMYRRLKNSKKRK